MLVVGVVLGAPAAAIAQQDGFTPINPTKARKTITLTGEDMLAARTLEDDCSPEDAERLRDAVGD